MSVVVKARPINIKFKPRTPARVIRRVKAEFSNFIINDDDELIDISTTDWYKKISAEMTPARYLKTYREIMDYSQAQLGELCGVPASRISDFETGVRSISKEIAKKFGALFKVSPANFI